MISKGEKEKLRKDLNKFIQQNVQGINNIGLHKKGSGGQRPEARRWPTCESRLLGSVNADISSDAIDHVGRGWSTPCLRQSYLKQRRQEHMDRPNSASWDSLGSIMDVELVKANARANAEALAESETEETYAEVEVTAMVAADRI